VDNTFKYDEFILKSEETKLLKYGDINYNNPNKRMNTLIMNHGVTNPMFLKKFVIKVKNTKIKNGFIISDDMISEFLLYKRNVNRITRSNKNELYKNWNGLDHYDGEYIKNNTILNPMDRKYPTIDHKMSIYNGFLDKIDYNIIGNLNNLCITKKYLNSKKGKKTNYFDFIKL